MLSRSSSEPEAAANVAHYLRNLLLLCVGIDFCLIVILVVGADSPLKMPRGIVYLAEAILPLLAYASILFWAPMLHVGRHRNAFQTGAFGGIAGGLLQIIHHALENFGNRVGEKPGVTLTFMLATFLAWTVAGYFAARTSTHFLSGVLSSCWAAMISVVGAVTFGLILVSAGFPPAAYVATWNEFQQSGWSNSRAFAIANAFEAVLNHLATGPIVGMVLGLIAGVLGRIGRIIRT